MGFIPKARAKRIDTQQWVYGYAIIRLDNTALIYVPESENTYIVDKSTIGLCSNRKDKNGVYVFDGDLVDVYSDGKSHGLVISDNIAFGVTAKDNSTIPIEKLSDFSVVGNKYDN